MKFPTKVLRYKIAHVSVILILGEKTLYYFILVYYLFSYMHIDIIHIGN